jgi:penicillin-binding protein 1C
MRELGFIDKEEQELAAGEAIVLQRHHGGFLAPHAVELALQETHATGTLRTTLDAALQQQVERIVESRVTALKDRGVEHAAVVVLENKTGHVLALVGSRDFSAAEGGQINGAWEPRSPGSALKPFTYALAMEQSGGPATLVPDLPLEYPTPTGLYQPTNYDGRCYGPMTFRMALGNSLNLSAVRVLQSVGGAEVLHGSLQKLGISTLTESPEHYGLGLTIGNAPMRLLELTNAYACLARLGDYQPWTLLQDAAVAAPADPTAERRVSFISPRTAWFIADILQDNAARAITFGNQSILRLPFRAAVKTGTSTNYRDNWCLGYVPEFTVGVWVGNFKGLPMNQVSGVTGAAPIWRDVMLKLKATHTLTWYETPSDVSRGRIDLRTGRQLSAQLPPVRHSRTEVWAKERPPPLAQRRDYEMGTGKAILSPEYESWIQTADNWLGDSVTTRSADRYQPLRIAAPTAGLVILSGQRILLRAEPSDGVQWSCNTLQILQEQGQTWATGLRPGRHVITAKRGDDRASTHVEVKAP